MADVLHSGPDGPDWRPGTRQLRLGAGVLVAALLLAAAHVWTEHLARARAQDRASVQAFAMAAFYSPDVGVSVGTVAMTLQNTGPSPRRLIAARLLLPGYGEVTVHVRLSRAGQVTVAFPTPRGAACTDVMGAPRLAGSVDVKALTDRGLLVTRRISLSPQDVAFLQQRARVHCGYTEPEQALEAQARDVRSEGRNLVEATLQLRNSSRLSLRLLGLTTFAGLAVSTDPTLPALLPGVASNKPEQPFVSLHIRLRLISCAAMRAEATRLRHELQNPGGFSEVSAAVLTAHLEDGAGLHDVQVRLAPAAGAPLATSAIAGLVTCARAT